LFLRRLVILQQGEQQSNLNHNVSMLEVEGQESNDQPWN